MENQELPRENNISLDKDTQINLVVNNMDEEDEIDMGRVFHNMKVNRHFYGAILALCIVIGASVPLLIYQFTKKPLTVFSVVTLNYEVDNDEEVLEKDPEAPARIMVKDLTAPDGEELDLNQITSSYVLQNALNSLELSQPVTLSNLRSNITITRTLSEESSRQQEIITQMLENKSNDAYQQMQNAEFNYTNAFVVSLANGFGDEDSRSKIVLKDDELRQLLDSVLVSYNEYLVKTYADKKLPDDAISVVDIEELDIPESVDQLRSAMRDLYTYGSEKPEEVRNYRSWRTGYSLNDLMEMIRTVQEVDVEYLSSYVYANGIARDRNAVIDNQKFKLLVAQTELNQINENIDAVETLLDNYKNDEILVSVPENDSLQTAQTNTDYYNNLILEQAENYRLASEKMEEIDELETRIAALEEARNYVTQQETEEAEQEVARLLDRCRDISVKVRDHMTEVFDSTFQNNLANHSGALGKTPNFLVASAKGILIGTVVGAAVGFVIWLIGGLAPEMASRRERSEKEDEDRSEGKEADSK